MFACYSSDGVRLYKCNAAGDVECVKTFSTGKAKSLSVCRGGSSLAFLDGGNVVVYDLEKRADTCFNVGEATRFSISPCGRTLFIFKTYCSVTGAPQGPPNVSIYDVETKSMLWEYVQRSVDSWAPQWNSNSSVCAVCVNGELKVFKQNQYSNKSACRLDTRGMRHFSLSPSTNTPYLAVYIPGHKGQPSAVRVYDCQGEQSTMVANKSFFKADTVRLSWNDRGTDLLILSSTKLSDENYYGDQELFYLSASRSGSSAIVTMPRKGPIYQMAWKPTPANSTSQASEKSTSKGSSKDLFAVCHGFTPASVTVFGTNCDPLFDFGTGSWNQFFFNPHGNLLLAGLGGLPGDMSVWDFEQRERLSCFKTTDITSVSWLNDGEHLVMATTTPRLRVNNGFGIWHYSGKQLGFVKTLPRDVPRPATVDLPAATEHELYQVSVIPQCQLPPMPKPRKFEPVVLDKAGGAAGGAKSGGLYVPPSLRNRSEVAKQAVAAAYRVEIAKPKYEPGPRTYLPVGMYPAEATGDKRPKRHKNAAKKASATANADNNPPVNQNPSPQEVSPQPTVAPTNTSKETSQIRKKLNQIEKLKAEQAAGKQLAFNQIEKIARESELREELAKLSLSS